MKLAIFDLDGTLVRSGDTVLRIINDMRGEMGSPKLAMEEIQASLSLGGVDLIKKAFGYNVDHGRQLDLFRQKYFDDPLADERLYLGAKDFLEKLESYQIEMAICSNKPRKLVDKVIKHHALERYFDCIVAGGDGVSNKPKPDGLMKIIRHKNVAPFDVIFIGDSVADQIAANLGGIKFFFHQHGYDDGVLQSAAHLVFKTYFELMEKWK